MEQALLQGLPTKTPTPPAYWPCPPGMSLSCPVHFRCSREFFHVHQHRNRQGSEHGQPDHGLPQRGWPRSSLEPLPRLSERAGIRQSPGRARGDLDPGQRPRRAPAGQRLRLQRHARCAAPSRSQVPSPRGARDQREQRRRFDDQCPAPEPPGHGRRSAAGRGRRRRSGDSHPAAAAGPERPPWRGAAGPLHRALRRQRSLRRDSRRRLRGLVPGDRFGASLDRGADSRRQLPGRGRHHARP